MKVLVVDDEAILLKSCRLVLEAEGCDVIAAASVDEALAVLERQVPDLLLIDVKMPVLDGIDATIELLHDPEADLRRLFA